MAQNIYDTPEFFENYSQLRRSVDGLEGAAEWPSLRALIPDLSGRRVLDLGCGFGWFCRWASGHGAAHVLGLDLSEKMLERARAETGNLPVTYERADLEQLDLPEASFDFAYSSLALHYVVDAGRLLGEAHRALRPGSEMVFSVEHPIFMAPAHPEWMTDRGGSRAWPLNGYSVEGPRTTDWLSSGVVKQHRTMGTWINLLIGLGFEIRHVEEWAPTDGDLAAHPEWAEERDRPMFLLIAVRRKETDAGSGPG